jgi:TolB protein
MKVSVLFALLGLRKSETKTRHSVHEAVIIGVSPIALAVLCAVAAAASPLTVPFQLTYSQNMDARPSPDGRRFVYISVILGKEQLITMNTDGSQLAQITHDDADHEDESWSPNGRQIVFVRVSETEKRLYIVDSDGSRPRAVSPAGGHAIHPEWSPDGTKIIYSTDDDRYPPAKNPTDIIVVELATAKTTMLIKGDQDVNTYPQWSPDMKFIVWRRLLMPERNSEVFVANADGSDPHNITNNPAFDGWPAWSPDGQLIAFASNRNSSGYQIFVMNPDGSDVRLVANTEGRATSPRWSPDSKTIYFTNCVARDYGTDCQVLVSRLRQ